MTPVSLKKRWDGRRKWGRRQLRPVGEDDQEVVEPHHAIFNQVFWATRADAPNAEDLHQVVEAHNSVTVHIAGD
jgi:hypothetical protein